MRLVVCVFSAFCTVLACATDAPAQTPPSVPLQPMSEREAVARFMADDPRVRAIYARIEQVRATQAERTPWPNPAVTFARESAFGTNDTFLLARQELPTSGRRRHLQAAGRLAVEAAAAEARGQVAALQAGVREGYAALVLAQAREAALRDGVATLQRLIVMLRAREDAGEGSSYDRMRGARALLDIEADLAHAASLRAEAQGALASFLGPGVMPEALAAADTLDSLGTPAVVADLVVQALVNRGDYRSTELASAQFDAERTAATRLRLPIPTLGGGLKRSAFDDAASSGYQFSVDLAVPIFNRGDAAVAAAAAQKARADAEAASWRARIETEVRTALSVLAIQRDRLERYRASAAETAEPLVAVGRVGYEEGELGILELLDAERQALEARLRILELAAAARRAAINLDRAIGVEWRP